RVSREHRRKNIPRRTLLNLPKGLCACSASSVTQFLTPLWVLAQPPLRPRSGGETALDLRSTASITSWPKSVFRRRHPPYSVLRLSTRFILLSPAYGSSSRPRKETAACHKVFLVDS